VTSNVIPSIRTTIADSQFGVGQFRDFPLNGYGAVGDQPFTLRQAISSNNTSVLTAVNGLSAAGGGDFSESSLEGIYQVATGDGLTGPSPTSVPVNHTGVGGVGFRASSSRVIVAMSDAIAHAPGEADATGCGTPYAEPVLSAAHTRAQTKSALDAICARVIGVTSTGGTCNSLADFSDLATHTGARVPPSAWDVGTRPAGCAASQCCTGINGSGVAVDANGLCPLSLQIPGTGAGLDAQLINGVRALAQFAAFDVTSERAGATMDVAGNPLPGSFSTSDFVTAVMPVSSMVPPAPPVITPPTFNTTTFSNVTPGTMLRWNVAASNTFIPQTDTARLFSVTVRVLADGCTPLDQREILVVVPPQPIVLE
jgi:hypothetical protein